MTRRFASVAFRAWRDAERDGPNDDACETKLIENRWIVIGDAAFQNLAFQEFAGASKT